MEGAKEKLNNNMFLDHINIALTLALLLTGMAAILRVLTVAQYFYRGRILLVGGQGLTTALDLMLLTCLLSSMVDSSENISRLSR